MVTRLRSLINQLKAHKARRLIVLFAILAILTPVGVTTVTADPPPGCVDVDKDCLAPPLDQCPDQTEDFLGVIDGCPEDGKEPPPVTDGDSNMSCVGDLSMAAHWARLRQLDPVFRASGWQVWLKVAGITWDSISLLFPDIQKDARQVEEETNPTIQPFASGIQVLGTGVIIRWPNILTTDRPNEVTPLDGFQALATTNNPSVLYTNVELTGQGTIWIDGTNWGQFASVLGCENGTGVTSSTPQDPEQPAGVWCFTERQLNNRYGIVRDAQGASNGLLLDESGRYAGAVIELTLDEVKELTDHGWTIQGTNPRVKSAWNPESCRTSASKGGATAATFRSIALAVTTRSCSTLMGLERKFGIDISAGRRGLLYNDKNQVAGAVLFLNRSETRILRSKGWIIQGTNPRVKSAWAPSRCVPLSRGGWKPSVTVSRTCMTVAAIDSRFGIVEDARGTRNGLIRSHGKIVGAVVHLDTSQKKAILERKHWAFNGEHATIKSIFAPEWCIPLKRAGWSPGNG